MSVDSLLRKAIEKHDNLEYEEAGKLYKKILSVKPRHLDANYLLGTLYAECGEYEKARQLLTRAAQIHPGSPMVQVNLGNVYRKFGNFDLAVKCFSRAVQLMPSLYEAHLGLGSTLLDFDEDLDKAAECFQKALALAPGSQEIYHQMGILLERKGNFKEALIQLETARKLNPNIPGINLELGLICLREGNTEKSREYLREACRNTPNDVKAAYFLEIVEGRIPGDELKQKFSQLEFNTFAARFDNKLTDKLGYTLPSRVVEILRRISGSDHRYDSVADLGCGTGLVGEKLRGYSCRLTGIDISENMLELARRRKCFDQLYCGDVVTVLNEHECFFDLFVATDVFIYIGKITALMSSVVKHAEPGALFLFSTEMFDGDGLLLQTNGRYAHSPGYIHAVMDAYECTVVSEEVIDLRLESGSWVKGNLFVVRIPGVGSRDMMQAGTYCDVTEQIENYSQSSTLKRITKWVNNITGRSK